MTVFSNRLIVIGSLLISAVSAAAFSQSRYPTMQEERLPRDRGKLARDGHASWRADPAVSHVQHIRPRWNVLESSQPRQGPGHGVWRRTGQREFGITFEKIVFSANGSVTGTLKVRRASR